MKKIPKLFKPKPQFSRSAIFVYPAFLKSLWIIVGLLFTVSCFTFGKLEAVNSQINNSNSPLKSDLKEQDAVQKCDFSSYNPIKSVMAVPVKLAKPIYPQEAKEKKAGGRVCVKVLINAQGDAEKTCALDTDKANNCLNEVDSYLKIAAETAALESKFKFIPTFEKLNINPGYVERIIAFNFVADEINETTPKKAEDSGGSKKKNKRKRYRP